VGAGTGQPPSRYHSDGGEYAGPPEVRPCALGPQRAPACVGGSPLLLAQRSSELNPPLVDRRSSPPHGGCCIKPRRARWIRSKAGLRKWPSRSSRASCGSPHGRARHLWHPLPRGGGTFSETALCNSLHGKRRRGAEAAAQRPAGGRQRPEEPGCCRSSARVQEDQFRCRCRDSAPPSIWARRTLPSARRGRMTAVVSLRDRGTVRRLRLIGENRRVRRAGRQHVERVDDQRHGALVP
jgi:hypothetical protein